MDEKDLKSRLADIERAAVLAWPALETARVGGWLCRTSNGGSMRANSVSTLADPGRDLDLAISEAEAFYHKRGAPSWFQVTEVSAPRDLQRRLVAHGFGPSNRTVTLARPLGNIAQDADAPAFTFLAASEPSADWLSVYESVLTLSRKAVAQAILKQIVGHGLFCSVAQKGQVLATALLSQEADVAIVECVAVSPHARRRGAGHSVMKGVAALAASQGADLIALQAVEFNHPAQALYRGLGYRAVGTYDFYEKTNADERLKPNLKSPTPHD